MIIRQALLILWKFLRNLRASDDGHGTVFVWERLMWAHGYVSCVESGI